MLNFNEIANASAPVTTNSIAINDCAIVNGISDTDLLKLVSVIKGMGYEVTQTGSTIAPVSAPVAPVPQTVTQSAPVKPAKTIAPAEDVVLGLTVKDNAVWFSGAKAPSAVFTQVLVAQGFKRDAEYERPDTYVKDYTDKAGNVHKAGSHKMGAWVLVDDKGRKATAKAKKFFEQYKTENGYAVTIKATEIEAQRSKIAERIAKRASK